MNQVPLAERLRPQSLQDILGQDHIVGAHGALTKYIELGKLPSCILWGPPGTGKTSLALVLSDALEMNFHKVSAISSGVKELRNIIQKAESSNLFSKKGTVLFIDEIHRFNKLQQDALLEAVEKGLVTLIGATTENPSFEVNNALLSRSIVFRLHPMSEADMTKLVQKAIQEDEVLSSKDIVLEESKELIRYSGGDARRLLNLLEFVVQQSSLSPIIINNSEVKTHLKDNLQLFDKKGEYHFDTISAFIKSIRGSDIDASLYYLARMIVSGEDPSFICRRLIISASEDIGLANPNALLIAQACADAVEKIGMPEGRIPMSQTTIYLASSPKSNSAYVAINKAIQFVKDHPNASIPLHLRNAPTKLMQEEGYGQGYLYPHDFSDSWVLQSYLPEEVKEQFYQNKNNLSENKMINKWKLLTNREKT